MKKVLQNRLYFLQASFLFLFFILFIRLGQIQILQHKKWKARAMAIYSRNKKIMKPRGSILDRNGVVLAQDIKKFSIYAAPGEMGENKATIFNTCSRYFNIPSSLAGKLDTHKWFLLKRGIEEPVKKDFQVKHKGNLNGLHFIPYFERHYPEAPLALEILGLTGYEENHLIGREGLEYHFDSLLSAHEGRLQQFISLKGEAMPTVPSIIKPATGGANLVTTIDAIIQEMSEIELQTLVDQFKPTSAEIVVMDVMNGDILAMASHSDSHPKDNSSYHPKKYRNRPLLDVFEPGSTMKIFTMGEVIEKKKLSAKEEFFCPGFIEVYDLKIRCNNIHRRVRAKDIITHSCNVGAVIVANKLSSKEHYSLLRRCGFGEVTGLTAADQVGILNPPSQWSGVSSAYLGIGQEMAVTGLQLVRAFAAIANGGKLMLPKIVKEIRNSEDYSVIQIVPKRMERRIFSAETCKILKTYLMSVVEKGGGRYARDDEYTFAGKTGTAQKAKNGISYEEGAYITSFVGFAPVKNPRIALLVQADEPQGKAHELYGGKVAAPIFRTLTKKILHYLKVFPDKKTSKKIESNGEQGALLGKEDDQLSNNTKAVPIRIVREKTMPDLRGLTIKEVLHVLEGTGVLELIKKDPEYAGSGKVVAQIPGTGSPIQENGFVKVFLSYEID
ncbi:penicillin-binding protein [Candidatus Riflebacteria bacterium]